VVVKSVCLPIGLEDTRPEEVPPSRGTVAVVSIDVVVKSDFLLIGLEDARPEEVSPSRGTVVTPFMP